MRLLFVTLEFVDPIFSGNGVYGRSLVMAVSRVAPQLRAEIQGVDVLCCVPDETLDHSADSSANNVVQPASSNPTKDDDLSLPITAYAIRVPAKCWRRLDRQSAWRNFAEGASHWTPPHHDYSCAYIVDWTGWLAFHALEARRGESPLGRVPKRVFLNFRVFSNDTEAVRVWSRSSSAVVPLDEGLERGDWVDAVWYASCESHAVAACDQTIALCAADAKTLLGHALEMHHSNLPRQLDVLCPPLRNDVWKIATCVEAAANDELWTLMRRVAPSDAERVAEALRATPADVVFVTCLVRLDPAKEAHRFPAFMSALERALQGVQQQGFLIVPFVAGAAGDAAYAADVVANLRRLCPLAVVASTFLNAADFAILFRHTLLNVHPCTYDAYGMTIVEAAAFGVPSLVHHVGQETAVGAAAELLLAKDGGVWPVDWSLPADEVASGVALRLVEQRMSAFGRPECIFDVNHVEAAYRRGRALGYTEAEAAQRLIRMTLSHSQPE